MYCLQACIQCTFQPGNVTSWGSEGVKVGLSGGRGRTMVFSSSPSLRSTTRPISQSRQFAVVRVTYAGREEETDSNYVVTPNLGYSYRMIK